MTWCAAEADSPEHGGDKWDLGGSGANVFQIGSGKDKRDVVGVGEKSGVYVLLDAKTGAFVWNTLVGPGGDQGGFEWGTAYDGDRIYASITNQHHIPYKLTENGDAHEHDRHRRFLGCARSRDREDPLADGRPHVATMPGFRARSACGTSPR